VTPDELAAKVAASRAAQGLGPFVVDPAVIAQVAAAAAVVLRTAAGVVPDAP